MVLTGKLFAPSHAIMLARTKAKFAEVSRRAPDPAVVKRFDCVADAALSGSIGCDALKYGWPS
jgi:hypothetical protein